jgi:hypothetical protein
MSLVLADRVRETTQTTGTGTLTLDGAVQGFQSFSVIGNNNTTYYTINRGSEWEVGIGTYYGGTLSRDTVYASSNGTSKVNFSAGSKDVFVTYPAEKSVNQDENNRVLIPYTSGTTNVGSLNVGNATAHTDSGVIAGFTASEPLYLYTSLQNTSASNTSYASYAVNDGGHTAYGELGINNANYSYSAAGFPNNGFSTPLATFVQSFGGPLVLGSWDSQKISFIVNGAVNTADAMTIETTGAVTIPTAAVTGGAINGATIGGTTPAAGTFTTLTSPILKSATGSATTGVSLETPLGAQATIIDIGDGTRLLRLNGGSAAAVNSAGVSSSVGILQLSGSNSDVRTYTGGRGSTLQFNVLHTASAVDYVQVTGATTASKVVAISAQGSDTDVTLSLSPKGAGTIRFGTYTASVLTPTGYITITDSGGTSRRLLVG